MQGGGEGRLGDGEGESGGGGSGGRRGRWGGARVLDRGRLFILLLEKGVVACILEPSTHRRTRIFWRASLATTEDDSTTSGRKLWGDSEFFLGGREGCTPRALSRCAPMFSPGGLRRSCLLVSLSREREVGAWRLVLIEGGCGLCAQASGGDGGGLCGEHVWSSRGSSSHFLLASRMFFEDGSRNLLCGRCQNNTREGEARSLKNHGICKDPPRHRRPPLRKKEGTANRHLPPSFFPPP